MTEQFTLVGSGRTFAAVRFSDPWDGWAVPVVTIQQLTELVESVPGATLRWDGDVAVVNEERYPADGDGLYLLEAGFELLKVVPDGAPPFTFTGDWHSAGAYRCWGFDKPWNGWDTPIVDRETLEAVVGDLDDDSLRWDGQVAVIRREGENEQVRLEPDAGGKYHLGELGWCFTSADG